MTTITVSSHALVRFLERAVGFDFTFERRAIAWTGFQDDVALLRYIERDQCFDIFREAIAIVVQRGAELGAVSVRYAGLTFCLIGRCVVTIIEGRANPWRLVGTAPLNVIERRIVA